MPPKRSKRGSKKGSRKKKSHLTVQERNAIIKQKMAAEKDKRIRRKRLTKLFLKVKSDKEYALLKAAQQDILVQWRPTLREMRKAELLKELKLMQAAFERSFDKKNELIKELEGKLRDNDKDYDDALDNHMYNIDKGFEFFKKRMVAVKKLYTERKQALLEGLYDENKHLMENHQKGINFLKSVTDAVEQRHLDNLNEWKAEVQLRKEELQNKLIDDGHLANVQFSEKLTIFWANIKERLTLYDHKMTPLRAEYLKLRDKDNKVCDAIDVVHMQLQTLTNGLSSLVNRIKTLKFATECYEKELLQKKTALREQCEENAKRYRFFINRGKSAIRVLALTVHSLLEKLEENANHRARLLIILERCRRKEREDEKVDPFMGQFDVSDLLAYNLEADSTSTKVIYTRDDETPGEAGMLHLPQAIHTLTCSCKPCTCEFIGENDLANLSTPLNKLISDYSLLERFWVRSNRCSLEIGALQEKRDKLANDNLELKMTLRNYMGGLNPLDHDPDKLMIKAMEEDKRSVGISLYQERHEFNRRERSRKVGGIRMH